jgi:hypothetical protein
MTREPGNEVLPFVWAKANNSGVRQLAWLTRDGVALADGTGKLALVLTKAEATLAGLGAEVNPKAADSEAFKRGVRFGKTGWNAAVDKQFVTGRVWRFTGVVPGTVTEATREEAEAILGPYNDSKVAAAAAAGR